MSPEALTGALSEEYTVESQSSKRSKADEPAMAGSSAATEVAASSTTAPLEEHRSVRRLLGRRVVLGAVFVVVAFGIVLGSGLGTLSSFGWEAIATICPLGALESMVAAKLAIPQAVVFLVLFFAFSLLVGKVFCAWVCPVPPLRRIGEAVARRTPSIVTRKQVTAEPQPSDQKQAQAESQTGVPGSPHTVIKVERPLSHSERALLKKSSSKPSAAGGCATGACASCVSGCESAGRPPLDSRHLVLGGSLLSAAIFGFPVFCLVCPVGLTFATIIALVQLFGFQTLSWGLLLFPLFLVLELVVLRKWCHRFCPLGALMSLFARPNRTLRPQVDESKCLRNRGIDCQVCTGVCPEGLDPHGSAGMHECSKCGDCAVNCPAHAITFPVMPPSSGKAPRKREADGC